MADKYEEMARQMRADDASEKMTARFVAEEVEEDEFRRSKGVSCYGQRACCTPTAELYYPGWSF